MTYPLARTPSPDRPWDQRCAGDWWYAPYLLNDDGSRSNFLGSYYYDHNADRSPIMVTLPGGCDFCVDSVPSREIETGGTGWVVTGSPKDGTLTVSPSIRVGYGPSVRTYHGWLGVNGTPPNTLSEDVEGNAVKHLAWQAERHARRGSL